MFLKDTHHTKIQLKNRIIIQIVDKSYDKKPKDLIFILSKISEKRF